MKRGFSIFIFIIALGMISSLPSALAQVGHSGAGGVGSSSWRNNPYAYGSSPSYYSPYAYNPYVYNPYVYNPNYPLQNQVIRDPTLRTSSYEWSDVTRYPGWYRDPENYQQLYRKFGEEPKTLTSPYREVKKPSSWQQLTSPYED